MSKTTQIRKDIASHERNFSKDDLASGYKLYQIYTNGKYEKNPDGTQECILERNPKLAEKYLLECEEILRKSSEENGIHVTNINLSDFRKFKNLKVKLDRKLTVIIGENGVGKTTIIDGLTKSLSWLSANIIKQGGVGRRVTEYDVNIESLTFSEVTTQIKINKNTNYSISLYKTSKGAKESKNSQLEGFEQLGGLYRNIDNYSRKHKSPSPNLPLIVSYSVNRTNIKSNKTFNLERVSSVQFPSKLDVYKNESIDGTGNFEEFSEWFMVLTNRSGEELRKQLDSKEKTLEALKLAGADDSDNHLHHLYQDAQKEYMEVKSNYADRAKDIKSLDIVKNAIISTVPGFSDIFIDKSSGRSELKVKANGRELNIFQTSQGQHVFISMIGDITKKLITLNPDMENPLLGNGIVLIDEIELHLHPKWQQNIISSLTKTFPNIQFIVTTHSPQVLSTVDKSNIRQFSTDERGNIYCRSPQFQTKGVRSADILAEIMGTNSVPDVEEAHKVDQFTELLQSGDKSSAVKVLEELVAHFGETHPIILDCNNKVDIYDMKERIKAKRNLKD